MKAPEKLLHVVVDAVVEALKNDGYYVRDLTLVYYTNYNEYVINANQMPICKESKPQ